MITTEKQYDDACIRIEELLKIVDNDTPTDDKDFIELNLLSDIVIAYEEEYFPNLLCFKRETLAFIPTER